MTGQLVVALVLGLAATVEDIRRRRISNWIPAALVAAGLATAIVDRGWRGGLSSVGGALAGFAVFFVFYWLGGMGGGDVKLMAGFGAVVCLERLVAAALWTSIIGGLLALAVVTASAAKRRISRGAKDSDAAPKAIPYAPAIALGALVALMANA